LIVYKKLRSEENISARHAGCACGPSTAALVAESSIVEDERRKYIALVIVVAENLVRLPIFESVWATDRGIDVGGEWA